MRNKETNVQVDQYYLKRDELVQVKNINRKENRVVIKHCDSALLSKLELDTAHLFLQPVFMINEAGRLLNRAPATLRKYETLGLTAPAKQYTINGKGHTRRFYTVDNVLELADFFATRRPVGRPAAKPQHVSKIDRYRLESLLNTRFKENNGRN